MQAQQAEAIVDKFVSLDISPDPSPSLTHRTVPSLSTLDLDLTLPTALSNLIHHLVYPLSRIYSPKVISALRLHLTSSLTELYAPTWVVDHPQHNSGKRSLICTRELGLPPVLRKTAKAVGVEEAAWRKALARAVDKDDESEARRRPDEWEVWCDPGTVIWRYGGWEWEDIGFEPSKVVREPFQIIWQSSNSPKPAPPTTNPAHEAQTTPARTSRAIPIRAPVPLPAVFAIPPTPAHSVSSSVPNAHRVPSPSLLPAVSISRTPSPSHSDISSGYESSFSTSNGKNHSRASSNPSSVFSAVPKPPSRASHRGSGSGSTSSNASSISDNSGVIQLLTPDSRPPSVDMFTSKSKSPTPTGPQRGRTPSPSSTARDSITPGTAASVTPTVTPYDGGNVTVLGGGVKLGGGGSRASSVISTNRTPIDRSRSPSISLASRALTSAMGPNGSRKTRTRRRIMPTYLGHLGQPGVGGPITGAFGGGGYHGSYSQPGSPWSSVGVGMPPPPAQSLGRPNLGQPRVSSA